MHLSLTAELESPVKAKVEIIRVLHARQDPNKHFK
jgi:plasmid stabilization system protein ParE